MSILYMAICLLCYSELAFVYNAAEKKNSNRFMAAAGMAALTTIIIIIAMMVEGITPYVPEMPIIILGIITTIVGILGIPCFMAAMKQGDVSITWTICMLSFAASSVATWIYPAKIEVVLIDVCILICASVAVFLLGMDMYSREKKKSAESKKTNIFKWITFTTLAFLSNTTALYCFALAADRAPKGEMGSSLMYMLLTYPGIVIGAFLVVLFLKTPGSKKWGLIYGLPLGVGIGFGALLTQIVFVSRTIPEPVFFSVTTGGSNVLVVIISVLFLKERPGVLGWLGLVIGLTALVLAGFTVS